MASTKRRYSKQEFAHRGDAIYANAVHPHLTPAEEGKFVAIDIETSAYAIDSDELTACDQLRARLPAAQIWMVRVGALGPSLRRSGPAGHTMITGVVKTDEGRIRLKVKGPQRREREVEAVIDTGYTASLTLPPTLIAALGLRWQSLDRGTLAGGSECLFDVYEGKVLWDGKVRRVLIDEADTDPLIGMGLLRGYELKMQVRSGGEITIQRLL